jgi:hypothetical protein
LFAEFSDFLASKGFIMNEGKMIDASFTIASHQRNIPEENKRIKEGHGDELWKSQLNKKKHKDDVDARWTKKNGEKFYGYKDHAKVDVKSKLHRNVCCNGRIHT